MAASKRPEPPRPGLSVPEALRVLALIDAAMAAYEATAPAAVAAIGGRPAVQARCQMTCVGLVPRLDHLTWERMAAEHAEAGRLARVAGDLR